MAIIKCPACGKQVTDRMEKCPHCNAVLKENNTKKINNADKGRVSIADNIIGIVTALVFTFILYFFRATVMGNIYNAFGDMVVIANAISAILYRQKGIIILIIGAAVLCGVSVLLRKKGSLQLAWGVAATILLAIAGYFWQNLIVHNHIDLYIREEKIEEVLNFVPSISFFYGVTFMVFLGSLSLMSFGRKMKYSMLLQLLSTIVFFFVSYILDYIFLYRTGIRSSYIAFTLSGILILGFAMLINKGFQQLITPKKIS